MMFLALIHIIFQLCAADITNERVMIDMIQNNPGDAVAWQQSKYFEATTLKGAGYTGQTTTGEMTGTQAVDFSSTGHDFFPAGSKQRLWLDAYSKGISRFIDQAKHAGVKAYFFVDLLVFPTFVIDAYPNITGADGKLVWNAASRQLLSVLVNETFTKFPDCDGWIVRTGETYTYDTPYHIGNSPNPSKSVEIWADFATTLRQMVCVQQQKQLFFRSWDNWPSEASYYLNMTNRVPTHPLLYFSVKHSSGDFVRPASWNPTLGIGKHAQVPFSCLLRLPFALPAPPAPPFCPCCCSSCSSLLLLLLLLLPLTSSGINSLLLTHLSHALYTACRLSR
jgi:hypothetical protein